METCRGCDVAATWLRREDESGGRRGYDVAIGDESRRRRGYDVKMSPGDAAAATWLFGGHLRYGEYFNSSSPRLLVRFEDLLFDSERTIRTACECVGGTPLNTFTQDAGVSKDRSLGHYGPVNDRGKALRLYARRADLPLMTRGDAAAATWMNRGDAAAATWTNRGDAGRDVDILRSESARPRYGSPQHRFEHYTRADLELIRRVAGSTDLFYQLGYDFDVEDALAEGLGRDGRRLLFRNASRGR